MANIRSFQTTCPENIREGGRVEGMEWLGRDGGRWCIGDGVEWVGGLKGMER